MGCNVESKKKDVRPVIPPEYLEEENPILSFWAQRFSYRKDPAKNILMIEQYTLYQEITDDEQESTDTRGGEGN